MLICQSEAEYKQKAPRQWYGYPRGWTNLKDIFINKDAFFIDRRDMELLIAHEQGHIDGYDHTLTGLMSPYGIVRYFTTKAYKKPDKICAR